MDAFFFFKKTAGILFSPLPVFFLLLLLGIYFLSRNKISLAKKILIGSCIYLYVHAIPLTAFYSLRALEMEFPKFEVGKEPVDNIVVLGCWNSEDKELPVISNVAECSLKRLVEGARMLQHYPNAILILSGNKWKNRELSHPEYLLQILRGLDIDESRVVIEESSKDTSEEATNLQERLENKNNLLITSASHMRRAARIFKENGIHFRAVPVDHLTFNGKEQFSISLLIPTSGAIEITERAYYEFLGNTWVALKSSLN